MSLNQLFRNAKKAAALKKAALTASLITGAGVGFAGLMKAVDMNGNEIKSSYSSPSTSGGTTSGGTSTGFATTTQVVKRDADGTDPQACIKNPTIENCSSNTITQNDWDQFLPPEGLVVRDGRGRVIFKKCRSLTEGAKTAKEEMTQERARFDKFNNAMKVNIGVYNDFNSEFYANSTCLVKPKKEAPTEEPCPDYKNYTELKNYYRQQYYEMSNALQVRASEKYECGLIRDRVMAAADPDWKKDNSITVPKPKTASSIFNTGYQ